MVHVRVLSKKTDDVLQGIENGWCKKLCIAKMWILYHPSNFGFLDDRKYGISATIGGKLHLTLFTKYLVCVEVAIAGSVERSRCDCGFAATGGGWLFPPSR
jgi:hypothetical protein